MDWTWDPAKARANRLKHGLSFEIAVRVFDDPLHASRPDPFPGEERWQTIGMLGGLVIVVVHTWPEPRPGGDVPRGRIISARPATRLERMAYEEERF